jgi:hypothetical protein
LSLFTTKALQGFAGLSSFDCCRERVVGVARTLAVVHLGFLFSGAFGEGLY